MKILNIPKSQYQYSDFYTIKQNLDSYFKTYQTKNYRITLYGVYKKIRCMAFYAAFGDFVILSECISWLRKNNLSVSLKEIKRCMGYFQPQISTKEKNQLVKTFFTPKAYGKTAKILV